MSNVSFGRRVFSLAVVAMTILWTLGAGLVAPFTASAVSAGDLFRGTTFPAVYYLGSDGMRYTFPNEKTYFSWYTDFSSVETISDTEVSDYGIGGNVVYRPGSYWVKIQSDPKTYAVTPDGMLRWIETEAVAVDLYGGAGWNTFIQDVPDAFFADYTVAASLTSADMYYDGALVNDGGTTYLVWDGMRREVSSAGMSANRLQSKHVLNGDTSSIPDGSDLTGYSAEVSDVAQMAEGDGTSTSTGNATVTLAADTPAGMTVPRGVNGLAVLKVNITATGGDYVVNELTARHVGIGSVADIDNAYWYMGSTRLTEARSFNSATREMKQGSLSWTVPEGQTRSYTLVIETSTSATAANTMAFSLTGINGNAVTGVTGNTFTLSGNTVGTATVSKSGTISQPTIGQNDAVIGKFQISVDANAELDAIRLDIDNATDHADFKLWQGTNFLATGVYASQDYVDFDLGAPYAIADGNNRIFTVTADVSGNSGDSVTVFLDKDPDLQMRDTDLGGFNMAVTRTAYDGDSCTTSAGDCSYSTIQGGAVTFAYNGPAADDIAVDSEDQVLLAFTVTTEEFITVKDLDVIVYADDNADNDPFDATDSSDNDDDGLINTNGEGNVTDIKVWDADDESSLMGPLELDCVTTTCGADGTNDASQTIDFSDDFTMAAGESLSLEVRVDVDDTLTGGTELGATLDVSGLVIEDVNGDNLTLGTDIVPSSDIIGAAQTANSPSLAIQLASSPSGTTSVVQGVTDVNFVAFNFTAGRAEDVTVTSVQLDSWGDEAGATTGLTAGGEAGALVETFVASCSLYDGNGVLLAGPVGHDNTNNYFLFDNIEWTVESGQSELLDVFCNLQNPSDTDTDTFSLDITDNDVDVVSQDEDGDDVAETGTDAANGGTNPNTLVSIAPSGTLTVSAAASMPDAGFLLSSTTKNPVSKFKLEASNEDFIVTEMTFEEEQGEEDGGSATAYTNNISQVWVEYVDSDGLTVQDNAFFVSDEVEFADLDLYVPADDDRNITVMVDVPTINRRSGGSAVSGEKVRLGWTEDSGSGDDEFRAVGQGSNTTLDDDDVADGGNGIGSSPYSTDGVPTHVVREAAPTVAVASGNPSGTKTPGDQEVLRFNVSASSNEDIVLKEILFKYNATDNDGTESTTDNQPDWNECDTGDTTGFGVSASDFDFYNFSDLGDALDVDGDWSILVNDGTEVLSTCGATQYDVTYIWMQLTDTQVIEAGDTETYSLYYDSTGASSAQDDTLRFTIPLDPVVGVADFVDSGSDFTAVDSASETLLDGADDTDIDTGQVICADVDNSGACASGDEYMLVSNDAATDTSAFYAHRGYADTVSAAVAATGDNIFWAPSTFVWYDNGSETLTADEHEEQVWGSYLVDGLPLEPSSAIQF